MATLQHTLSGYLSLLRISRRGHLLVEGRSDKQPFAIFLDEFSRRTTAASPGRIDIDSAEDLIKFDTAGNREKVETVCEHAASKPYAKKMVGFVDREFRGFERNPRLLDSIEEHEILDRLVWSRGHSIENYYFEFETLRRPLRLLSETDHCHEALDLFKMVFEKTVRLACAASLAAQQIKRPTLIKSSVSRQIFRIQTDGKTSLRTDLETWHRELTKRFQCSSRKAKQFVELFQSWEKRVESADFDVARWMCHGHIGLAFIWAIYSRCVLEICRKQGYDKKGAATEAQRVLSANESLRFNACAEEWVSRSLSGHCSYPVEVFTLFGFDTPTP